MGYGTQKCQNSIKRVCYNPNLESLQEQSDSFTHPKKLSFLHKNE